MLNVEMKRVNQAVPVDAAVDHGQIEVAQRLPAALGEAVDKRRAVDLVDVILVHQDRVGGGRACAASDRLRSCGRTSCARTESRRPPTRPSRTSTAIPSSCRGARLPRRQTLRSRDQGQCSRLGNMSCSGPKTTGVPIQPARTLPAAKTINGTVIVRGDSRTCTSGATRETP